MAKQSGIHQLRGKIGGQSYYGQKGVDGGLVRKINEGLSNRVKTDAAYENTRLNAAEFGTAGSFAGACIRSIAERKRSMMKDFATGDLAKVIKGVILTDTTHAWGSRILSGSAWQTGLRDKLNQYAKLSFADYVGATFGISCAVSGGQTTVSQAYGFADGWGSLLAAKGADGVEFQTLFVFVSAPASGDAPYRAQVETAPGIAVSATLGQSKSDEKEQVYPYAFKADGDNILTFALVVALPYRTIGSKKYTLQELCTYEVLNANIQK